MKNSTLFCFPNFIVISTIPIAFFISITFGYLGFINLNVPIHSLYIISFILFIFLLFIPHNANYSICKMRSHYLKMDDKLRSELFSNMLEIDGKSKSILDFDKFLQNHYSDIRNDNFASVASSIFPMLGILGTFIAIAISMPNFSVNDTDSLNSEISLLLSGVGSAFFASIYGILLSLIWTYFEKRGLSKVDKFFSEIKDKNNSKIWSENELKRHRHNHNSLKENQFITALKETFNLDLMQNINKNYMDEFKEIMEVSNKNFSNISQNIESSSKALKETIEQIDNTQNSLDAHKEIQKSIKEFTEATKGLNTTINSSFEKIDAEVGDIVVKLADFATHVSLESKEVQDSIMKYHQQIAARVKVK